jgi:hypothetical protein
MGGLKGGDVFKSGLLKKKSPLFKAGGEVLLQQNDAR